MMKDKWLRVRLNDEQDQVLERYAAFRGISRSEVVRQMIDTLPSHPNQNNLNFQFDKIKGGRISMEVTDSLQNKYVLSVDYRPNFNLWRIALQKLGLFNQLSLTTQVDLVKQKDSPDNAIWLNYIVPSMSNNAQETEQLVWDAVEQLKEQEGWTKIYGELTMEMIENNPKRLSWLKARGFNIQSQANQEDFQFCLDF